MPDPVTSAPDGGAITKGAVPFKSCHDVSDKPWDGDEAIARIRKHCSKGNTGKKEDMDWKAYEAFFTWVDSKNPEAFDSYKCPHHDIVDGKMVLLRHKLAMNVAEVHGGRAGGLAVPESDLSGITSHLRKHYEEDLKEPFPEGKPSTQNATGDKSVKCPGDPECKDADDDGDGDEVMEAFKPGDHVRHKKSKMCGEVKSIHTKGRHLLGHDEMDDDDREEVEASEKSPVVKVKMHDEECKCAGPMSRYIKSDLGLMPEKTEKAMGEDSGPDGGFTTKPIGTDTDGEEPVDNDDLTGEDGDDDDRIKRHDHVDINAKHYKGVGVVHSVHKRGHVPDVDEDIKGTPDEPAARVRCYKAMGDGHVATEHHVGVLVKHLAKREDLKAPTKMKAVVPPAKGAKGVPAAPQVIEVPIPTVLSSEDEDRKIREQLPTLIKTLVDETIYRYVGGV